jgi:hypothetical protein
MIAVQNENSIMAQNDHGLWRASANEAVPSDDFSEALMVLPEWIDGSLGAGQASEIHIEFNITTPGECTLVARDNGVGLTSEKRMKEWSSKDTGNSHTENIYGHGSKKVLTKFNPDYLTSNWKLHWRKQDRRGVSGCLNTLHSPFRGLETRHTEDEDNEDICPTRGTQWNITFDKSVLGKSDTAAKLMSDLQEIIRSRYEPSYYQKYTIYLSVTCGVETLTDNSGNWKSLKETLDCGSRSNVIKTHDKTITVGNTKAVVSLYMIVADGRTYHIPGMPTYGRKNMKSSRVHLARNGRYIEAMPYADFIGKETHNSENGKIAFVSFEGEDLPTPCTTKVKFQPECPNFKKMIPEIVKYFKSTIPSGGSVASTPTGGGSVASTPTGGKPVRSDTKHKGLALGACEDEELTRLFSDESKHERKAEVKKSENPQKYDSKDIRKIQELYYRYGDEKFKELIHHAIRM